MRRAGHRRARWIAFVVILLLLLFGVPQLVTRLSPTPEKALFIGDSYTFGVGATSEDKRWTTLVARAEGWQEDNRGLGGTGYLATAGPSGCGRDFCENYPDVARQVAGDDPDIVVIAGGQNDFEVYASDQPRVAAAVQQTYRTVHELMPKAEIVAVGPSTAGPVDDLVRSFDGDVRQAAASVDAHYISLLEPEAVIAPGMVLPDHAHVGDVGHQAIAQRVIDSLR